MHLNPATNAILNPALPLCQGLNTLSTIVRQQNSTTQTIKCVCGYASSWKALMLLPNKTQTNEDTWVSLSLREMCSELNYHHPASCVCARACICSVLLSSQRHAWQTITECRVNMWSHLTLAQVQTSTILSAKCDHWVWQLCRSAN